MTSVCKKNSRRIRSFKNINNNDYRHRGGNPPEQNITPPNSSGSILTEITMNILQLISKYAAKTIDVFIDPSLTEKTFESITPNIQQNIKTLKNFLMIANADDAEMRELIKKTIVLFSKYLVEVLEESQPEVDILIEKIWKAFNNVASKSAVGFTNASLTAAQAALAEIPGVGGFIILISAAGKMFNADAVIANEIMNGANDMKNVTVRLKLLLNKYIEKYKPEIESLYNGYINILKKYANTQETLAKGLPVANVSLVKGGGRKKSKNTLKRIFYSFNNFTRKNIIKTNE